ncbi:MAG: efflux RND transporter permease subunit, partial [Acidobacteriota bacterium]|nr:efflux RND transporter permease subunit [Acidobacteriota bacterium]
ITQAARLLPAGMPTPPTFSKVNPADQPVLYVALTSRSLPLWTLDEYAETRIAQRISMITGVAQVQVLGAQKYAVHVQMDPHAMASRQIGINEIENALKGWNVNLPTGTINGPQRAFTLQASGQLMSAAAYRSLIVAYRKGSPVRLEELGNIVDSVEDDKTASWFYTAEGSERAIVLAIQRQPGTNTIEVTDGIKRLLPVFKTELPPSVEMKILYDRSDTIRESYHDVQFTMLLTLALIVMVIYIFLRNVSATVIPSLALPFSIIGTFAIMYLLNYSLDNLSMMALILSIGFVVDDAIVMLENIVRHMEMGEAPMLASLKGSKEIGFTIVSMTLSLAAVFIPVLFLGGILGRLFKEFAVTICVAILISGVVSVTLTPMLCSRFLKPPDEQRRSWLYRVTERYFEALLHGYDRTLQVVLRYRPVTMVIFAVVLVATLYMFVGIPKGFIPDQDTDQIAAITEASQGTSFAQMVQYQKQIAEVVREDPNVEALMSSVGGAGASTLGGPNFGQLVVHLKPRSERKLLVNGVIEELRPKLANFPGMRVYLQNPPTIRIGGQVTKSLYQFSLESPDKKLLFAESQKLEDEIAKVPGLEDVASDLLIKSPQVNITIDRDKAAALQVNAQQIENSLYDAYGPRWVSTIYAAINEYKVLLELKPEYQADPRSLSLLYFKSGPGRLIPLDTLAKVTQDIGPQAINHYGQLPAVTISFGVKPGYALGNAVQEVQDIATRTLSPAITTNFQGAAKAFQSSLGNLWVLLIIA